MKALTKTMGAALALLTCVVSPGRAQQVQAALAQDSVAVGQPVQLNITVTGGNELRVPTNINVEGLDIQHTGKSEQAQVTMINGQLNAVRSAIFSYMIIPIKAGTYTIPSISVKVGNKVLKTDPLTLNVGGVPGRANPGNVPVLPAIPVPQSQRSAPPSQPQVVSPHRAQVPTPPSEDEVVYGEIVLPRSSAYVGEVVPVEFRFYFLDPIRVLQTADRPEFSGDGFTVMNFGQPTHRQQEMDGRLYTVLVFQTAITPAKSGTLEISPAKLEVALEMPGSRGGGDPFSSFLGSIPQVKRGHVETKPLTLEVKALPKDGRPAQFGGAIGQFSIGATADPKKAAANDPISLNIKISGRGNFDAMSAPTLIDTEGWRTYPPGEKFTPSPSDPIGFNGEKTFEYMLLAREDRSFVPVAEFSYFDPAIGKYVTLKSPQIAVEAKGGSPAPAAPPAAATVSSPTPATSTPEPAAAQEPTGLVRTFTPATFQPFVESTAFLVANGALALTWTVLLLFGIGRIVSGSKSARAAAARKEARQFLHKMEPSTCPAADFYQHASDFVAARLGAHGRDALENAPLRPETKTEIGALLDVCDEMKYSTSGVKELSLEDRRRVVAQLKSFDEELR
jgi:hypothetical protein